MSVLTYLTRDVEKIPTWRYHLEKPAHSLLLGALLSVWCSPVVAVTLAVVGYLVIGKLLVKSAPSLDWIADLLIGALAIPAVLLYMGNPLGYVAALVWLPLYGWCVLHQRWSSP